MRRHPSHLLAKRALSLPMIVVRNARRTPRRWILALHDVGSHPWAYPLQRFDALLRWIRSNARPVSLREIISRRAPSGRLIHLTFDDGYEGVADRVVPALRRRDVPATVFLPTALLEEDRRPTPLDSGLYAGLRLMGWRDVRALRGDALVEFGSHGAQHRALTSLLPSERADEIESSREALSRAVGKAPDFLAYPYGECDSATADSVRRAGFLAAVTTRHGGIEPRFDRFRLPRVDVRADYEVADLSRIVRGEWDFLGWAQGLRAWPR